MPTSVPQGLPPKFTQFRDTQAEAVEFALSGGPRFRVLCYPTGAGKSLIYVAAALKSGKRTCILTPSKGLQSQLMREFGSCGLADIRGRANYRCSMRAGYTCQDGSQAGCQYRESRVCPYRRAQAEATSAWIVVSNYSAWTAAYATQQGWGQFDLLVCDEAADLPSELAGSLRVQISDDDAASLLRPPRGSSADSTSCWREWAADALPEAREAERELARRVEEPNCKLSVIREFGRVRNLVARLGQLRGMDSGGWIVEAEGDGYVFDPVSPAKYAEDRLFMGVPQVLMVSATVREKTMGLLGVATSDYVFREYPSSFDPARCPIYHVPTMRMNQASEAQGIGEWLTRIDQIISRRKDRKGIVHTVSFGRARSLLAATGYRDLMYWNERGELTAPVIDAYCQAEAPAVLVSPSVSTGYDFAGVQAEYQVIGKVPHPVPTKIQRAREQLDTEIGHYMAMQKLVQACGRIMRGPEDRGETLIIDDGILWFRKKYRHLAPAWFDARFRRAEVIPPAPPKLL